MKKTLSAIALAATLATCGLAVTAGSAAAYVACNASGECWHTDQHQRYAPQVHIVVHPDDWYFHQDWAADHNRHWRDYHSGRGYYNNGAWVVR